MPSQGVGGNGIASEFGDLTGMTRQEVDDFLRGLGAEISTNLPIVRSFHIRPDSEVVRTPAPSYASDGRRTNKGLRLDKDGSLVKTRDEFGNQIPGTHNTGEKVSN